MEKMNRRNFIKGLTASVAAGAGVLKSQEAHAMSGTLLENGRFDADVAELFGFDAIDTPEKITISIAYYDGDLTDLPLPPEEMRKQMKTKTFEFNKNATTRIDVRTRIGGVAIEARLKDGSIRKIWAAKSRTYGYFGVEGE